MAATGERTRSARPLDPAAVEAVAAAIDAGRIEEVEVAWPDHAGHPCGKRIDAADFITRSAGAGFAFCRAALAWDVAGEVQEGLRLTDWATGYPDMIAVPDLTTFRPLPWRERAAHVVADLVDHHGEPIASAPRSVLRRVTERLAELGYAAQVGVEIEFHLLDATGKPLDDGLHALLAAARQRARPRLRRDRPRPARLRRPRGRPTRSTRPARPRSTCATPPRSPPPTTPRA